MSCKMTNGRNPNDEKMTNDQNVAKYIAWRVPCVRFDGGDGPAGRLYGRRRRTAFFRLFPPFFAFCRGTPLIPLRGEKVFPKYGPSPFGERLGARPADQGSMVRFSPLGPAWRMGGGVGPNGSKIRVKGASVRFRSVLLALGTGPMTSGAAATASHKASILSPF